MLFDGLNKIVRKPFFNKTSTTLGLWLILAFIAWITKVIPEKYNNFLIFKQVFWHTIDKLSLYAEYPAEYFDSNHYGPFFSLVIAPFAVTPTWLGLLTWLLVLTLFLYAAIHYLPVGNTKQAFIYWICAHELLTALFMSQFNVAIAAIIILSYILIEKEKDIWAVFFIIMGTFIKLYGIVGLAFFFFSKHKIKFIISCVGWSLVMFVAPMLITGPDYIIGQYIEWFHSLVEKGGLNLFSEKQNVSLLGMIRKISGSSSYSDLYVIIAGLVVFALPYVRFDQYKHPAFRLTFLASVLLFVVLFSTGSESSTYIIAFTGVAIWYIVAPWKRSVLDICLLVFAFILTSMSPSDLFPKYLKVHYVYPYALKALPCVLIWFKLSYEMCLRDYRTESLHNISNPNNRFN